jgi:hypothetical protein
MSTSLQLAKTVAPAFVLDRRTAVPALIGRNEDFLIIAGLAGTSKDMSFLTGDGPNLFSMAGAMGGACMIGLGLALARPDQRVLVATGDGELLMSLGSLATIGVLNPSNLSIVCVDNGRYGETGQQLSHTGHGVLLDQIAVGARIATVRTIDSEADLLSGSRLLREGNGTKFILLRVNDGPPPACGRNHFAWSCRDRFRAFLMNQQD